MRSVRVRGSRSRAGSIDRCELRAPIESGNVATGLWSEPIAFTARAFDEGGSISSGSVSVAGTDTTCDHRVEAQDRVSDRTRATGADCACTVSCRTPRRFWRVVVDPIVDERLRSSRSCARRRRRARRERSRRGCFARHVNRDESVRVQSHAGRVRAVCRASRYVYTLSIPGTKSVPAETSG
jgi:hypothetical protein